MKEAESAFSSVLDDLFIPLSKRRSKEQSVHDDETRFVTRLSRAVESSGALDKLAQGMPFSSPLAGSNEFQGCFEHYATLRHQDPTFDRFEKAAAWLTSFDSLSSLMRLEREYAMLPYLPYMIVPFFPLFSERGGQRVERPKTDWEVIVVHPEP